MGCSLVSRPSHPHNPQQVHNGFDPSLSLTHHVHYGFDPYKVVPISHTTPTIPNRYIMGLIPTKLSISHTLPPQSPKVHNGFYPHKGAPISHTTPTIPNRYTMGLIPTKASLQLCDSVTASSFCRRRIAVVMVRNHMAENVKAATTFVEAGRIL